MSAGCFSWCLLHLPWGAKKQSMETQPSEKLEAYPSAIAPASTSVDNQVTKPKANDKISENSTTAVPTTKDYAMATVKEVLTLSHSAAGVMPVPFLQEAIGVALKIIQVCEEASAVEQKVKELQVRLGDLMIVIVDHVTPKDEEDSNEAVVKTSGAIEKHIKKLLRTLEIINEDLTKISAQKGWVIAVYKELNMNTLENCMNRLSDAMQNFMVANELHDSARINGLHARLRKMANKVDDMHEDIKNTSSKVDDVQEDIKHTAKDIGQILLELKRSGIRLVSDTLLRQELPLKPEIFHGRDDLVEDIAQLLLHQETSRISILGPGGMGKTSVALAVVELPVIKSRFPGGNIIWVPCIEATSATLLLEILYTQQQVPGDKQVNLDKILSELDASKQPRLILLDNFETPWNAPDGNQKQVGDILRRLAMLSHVAILVTMRGRYPPCDKAIKWQSKDIKTTHEAASLRIYHDINPDSENDPDVARLLATLGHMPFAVTLMAKLGVESRSTAKDLLDAWSESGPDILSNNPEESMNRSIRLSVESDLVKRNPNATRLLAILSLLPAGTTKENLRWWAPGLKTPMIPSALATLSQAALVVENKRENSASPVLFVIPVVQSFMQQQDRIAEEIRTQIHSSCCEYVLAHNCRFDDPKFPKYSKALAAEDTNIQSILFGSPPSQQSIPSDRTMEALIAFGWHRCDTRPNLEIANHTVVVAKATGVVKCIASAVWCLGKTYAQLGDHHSSYAHLHEAYRLFNTFPLSEVESQRLGCLCGLDLTNTARLALPVYEVVSLAQDVETKCALSDAVIHGRCLALLGAVYSDVHQPDDALRSVDRARPMLKAAGDTYNLAEAHQYISWVHYDKGRFPEALDAAEEAWKLAELTDHPLLQAQISMDLGKIFFNTDKDTKAWEHIEIALMKASYAGNRLTTARVLEYMGYGYLRRGDYQNAYGAYEAAAEKYLGTVDANDAKTCSDTMARIKSKEENLDMVVGFRRHGMDRDQTLFYPPVQVFASDEPISHS